MVDFHYKKSESRGAEIEMEASANTTIESNTTYLENLKKFQSDSKSNFSSEIQTKYRKNEKRNQNRIQDSVISSWTEVDTTIQFENSIENLDKEVVYQFHAEVSSVTTSTVSVISNNGAPKESFFTTDCQAKLRARVYHHTIDIKVLTVPSSICTTILQSRQKFQTVDIVRAFSAPEKSRIDEKHSKMEQLNATFWFNLGPDAPKMNTKSFGKSEQYEFDEAVELSVIHRMISTIVGGLSVDLSTATYEHYKAKLVNINPQK